MEDGGGEDSGAADVHIPRISPESQMTRLRVWGFIGPGWKLRRLAVGDVAAHPRIRPWIPHGL